MTKDKKHIHLKNAIIQLSRCIDYKNNFNETDYQSILKCFNDLSIVLKNQGYGIYLDSEKLVKIV